MVCFLLGFAIVWLIPMGWNTFTQYDGGLYYLIWIFGISPVLFAWITAWLIQFKSPRAFMTNGHKVGGVVRGLYAGAASLMFAAGGIVGVRRSDFPEILVLLFSASVATGLVLLLSSRVKAGLCARCHYDIRASLEFGRCPECGLAF